MLILIILLISLTTLATFIVHKGQKKIIFLGLGISLLTMFIGITIYIAKSGGYSNIERSFLFLLPKLQIKLQYLPISLDKIGYLVAVGRFLFPLCLILIALKYTTSTTIRKYRKFMWIYSIGTIIGLLIYYPTVFRIVVKSRYSLQDRIILWSFIWISMSVVTGMSILFWEYLHIKTKHIKKEFKLILTGYTSITLLYMLYSVQDPAQIYQVFGPEYRWIKGSSYISSALSTVGWFSVSLSSLIFLILGGVGLGQWIKKRLYIEKDNETRRIKIDVTHMGASIFVHSIKNQLLANRILNKKVIKEIEAKEWDKEKIKYYLQAINQTNEHMLSRMEELYKTVKNNAMYLEIYPIVEVIHLALEKFNFKYPDTRIKLQLDTQEKILVDKSYMSEAIYNVMINGYEAAREIREEEEIQLEIHTYSDRLYTVVEISDNGKGLAPAQQKNIFEPFFTTKNTNYNWGMGLYYVKSIIESHYGKINIESEVQQGTTIVILLPK